MRMENEIEKPKLRRTLNAVPLGQGRDVQILVHDQAGVSEAQLMIPPPLMFMISLFNGENTVFDIQAACTRKFGEIVMSDDIRGIIRQFDESLFLESPRFDEYLEKQVAAFRVLDVREASHAGLAYPAETDEFKKEMEGYFTGEGGPGAIGEKGERKCAGVIAPHFDLKAGGGAVAAHAFKALAESAHEDTLLVLGVNHGPSKNIYAATLKHFATPLGNVETDREFTEALAESFNGDLFEDEFSHRREHSIEFQAVFLAHALPGVKIVPVIVGGFHEMLSRGEKPSENAEISSFVDAVQKARDKTGRGLTLLAGVDFAHVGMKFGGEPVTQESMSLVAEQDAETIEIIAECNAEPFNENILKDNDARSICGYPAIYTFLRILGKIKGENLAYRQVLEEPTQSMVSFASMVFYT
jgi:AmmeMemoRadiSam system protein B